MTIIEDSTIISGVEKSDSSRDISTPLRCISGSQSILITQMVNLVDESQAIPTTDNRELEMVVLVSDQENLGKQEQLYKDNASFNTPVMIDFSQDNPITDGDTTTITSGTNLRRSTRARNVFQIANENSFSGISVYCDRNEELSSQITTDSSCSPKSKVSTKIPLILVKLMS